MHSKLVHRHFRFFFLVMFLGRKWLGMVKGGGFQAFWRFFRHHHSTTPEKGKVSGWVLEFPSFFMRYNTEEQSIVNYTYLFVKIQNNTHQQIALRERIHFSLLVLFFVGCWGGKGGKLWYRFRRNIYLQDLSF